MSTEFEFDAKVKEADDIDIKEYSFSPTLLENGVIDYSNIEHDKIFLVNKHDILEKEKPDWIPELDLDGLMADEFLPTTIKSSDGFYYVQAKKLTDILDNKNDPNKRYETQIYKMSSDILAATVDYYIKKQKALNKQVEKKETVGLPRRTKSMYTSRFQNMVDLLRFIPEYKENEALLKHYPNRSKSEAYRKQNKIIFDQYKDLLGNLKDKILDLNLDKIDYGNAYTKGEITSYGDTGLSNSLYEDFGVRIKKQNGSTFSLEQKNRVESVLKDTYLYYGDLSNISKDFHLKVSYADNCRQHARKAIGLFTPYHNAIGVSFFDDNTYERTTAVHEFAHFLDYTKGNEFSYRYASDKDGSLENQIATKYKKLIREQNENNKSKVGESKTIKLGDYWYRTCECFARAMEQDFELTIGLKEKCNPPAYLPEEIFNKEIKPLIEELKKENEIKLNLIPGKFFTLTTKIKGNVMEQTKDYETLENVFEDNKLIDSIFETVSKEFNEKNKDFFNIYEEQKSKQIENLSKNISNIKEKMLFSKIHSEMLKIRVEELKEMVKRCPNKDIALAVGIRYFNYFGNIEGNISHQNLYTRFGIGHYEKDQMVYPKPEELNSFISKLYENSKKQETYIWNHYEDGSCCLKAPNGEQYFVYDPDADEVKITEDSNWIRSEELNLGDKTFTQYAEDYILENNAATYISFETNGKNIEKEQNVDESKQYSFFVKDTAEFEMFEEFETITGLTAKEAISEYKRLREDGLKAGIGINIPSDTTFDDPKGLGTTILVRENGIDTFDIYGDSFIVDLKENNEKSQNRIAAYKELYEELQRAGLNVKEPKFLFDKHLELNNHKDSGEISIYRNKIFQINWLVKTLNISSETADMFYDNYTVYEEVGKNYPDWNYEKNTITIFEERNNKLDYYEVSPLEICEIALKHAKNKEEIEIIKTVMSKQNSLEKENEVMPKIDSYRINHNHDYFLSQKAIEFRIEQAKALTKAFFVENWEQSSKDEFVQKAMEYTLEPNSTVLFDKYLKEKEVEVYTKEEQEKMEQANNSIKEIVEQYSKELFVTYNQKEKLNKFWSEADIVDTVPDGWKKDQGVTTVPNGYVAITNGKSRFADGEKRETKLIREENYKQTELELDFGLIPMMPKIELKEPEKQIIKEEVKLPFSIINNVEKGRVNIKFDQKISDKKFNSILKELKSAGWRFSSFNKQWYPAGKAVEKSETFVKELQEKFAKSEETITYATASFEEFSQTLTESQIQKSPYDGIKFFDRNYKEIDEFVAYFNRNLNVFGKDVAPIDEKIAETIFESLQVDRVGTLNSRTIRLGLDASDNLVLLNKEKNEIETKNITLKELFFLAKETLEKEKQSLDEMLEKFNKKDNKEQFISVFGNLFQSAKDNNTELINKMDVIYDAYIKKPTQQTKKISKVQPLKVGDYIGDEVVQDVLEMAKGVYQATLMKNINEGPGTYFILDKNIVEKLNPELHQFLEEKEEHAIFKTSSRTTPHIIKELIDKNLCPPRDKEYYHQLDLHIQKNPLKYEVLYPVTKSNFKNKLKKLYEIDKHINHDVLTMGKQLLSFAIKDEKEEISRWLKDDVGCEDEKLLKNVFTKWVLEKEIIQEKNKDGYPPRGE